jgi:hypothetical protein
MAQIVWNPSRGNLIEGISKNALGGAFNGLLHRPLLTSVLHDSCF